MDYQDAADEAAIVVRAAGEAARPTARGVAKVVELVRRTRSHPDLRIGSSVRGAIDMVLVAGSLGGAAGPAARRPRRSASTPRWPRSRAGCGSATARPQRPRTSSASSGDQVFGPTAGGGEGKG